MKTKDIFKTLAIVITLLAVSIGNSAIAQTNDTLRVEKPVKVVKYKISGVDCPMDITMIEKALTRKKG